MLIDERNGNELILNPEEQFTCPFQCKRSTNIVVSLKYKGSLFREYNNKEHALSYIMKRGARRNLVNRSSNTVWGLSTCDKSSKPKITPWIHCIVRIPGDNVVRCPPFSLHIAILSLVKWRYLFRRLIARSPGYQLPLRNYKFDHKNLQQRITTHDVVWTHTLYKKTIFRIRLHLRQIL